MIIILIKIIIEIRFKKFVIFIFYLIINLIELNK